MTATDYINFAEISSGGPLLNFNSISHITVEGTRLMIWTFDGKLYPINCQTAVGAQNALASWKTALGATVTAIGPTVAKGGLTGGAFLNYLDNLTENITDGAGTGWQFIYCKTPLWTPIGWPFPNATLVDISAAVNIHDIWVALYNAMLSVMPASVRMGIQLYNGPLWVGEYILLEQLDPGTIGNTLVWSTAPTTCWGMIGGLD